MHTMLKSLSKSGSKSSMTSMSIIDKLPNFEIAIFWLSISKIFCFLLFPTQMSLGYEESIPSCPVQFARVCCSFQLDVETGFTKNRMVALEGYKKIASNPRLRENGSTVVQAGTAVWRKANSELIINYADEINVEECQMVQIGTNQGYSIIVIYRSPNQTKKGIKNLIEYVYKLEGECVIIGDLNLPDAD